MKIDLIFGGILAVGVMAAAAFAAFGVPFGGEAERVRPAEAETSPMRILASLDVADSDVLCRCFDAGFDLAGSDVAVTSSQYRTGYEQCRAVGDRPAADAWTAGWNARLSAKPYAATCRAWRRSADA